MTKNIRPRRSVLYMPGSNARAQEKAKTLVADALILDLEDAVAPDAKGEARDIVCANAASGDYGNREIIIRVNGLDTPWGEDDIIAAAKAGPDAILLPKVESADQVQKLEKIMTDAGAPEKTTIWCMMETPLGILKAEEIASASPRVDCFVMGTSDLVKELQAQHTPMRLPVITSFGLCLLTGRAYGLTVLDGVYLDLADEDGFRESCEQGVELGFDGKTLIHPKQLAPTNEVFAPSEEEVAHSRKVIEAFEAAEKEGKGVVLVDGKLVENLHVEIAKAKVAMADAIAAAAE
ncbi:HpcH/HpaI aldolase/citrate lyase family protein [Sneathiella sp. HT1-7]|uniref:HpcH/HpaI aldolase/citrate lyase family protein n=1 Tax=Sneathiella sp. HT1-7 TaxID=2887192 RepID=UPI001D15DB05|nr:CoA ester lyase [Sneathiella sp. HT1-7]MCC3303644.1 CoA ester lyase [Sneathiella sp. HT1-7]